MDQKTNGDLTLFNVITAICLLLGGLLIWFYLIPQYVAIRQEQAFGLSPTFMPKVAAASIVLLSVVLLVKSLKVLVKNSQRLIEESEEGDRLEFGSKELCNIAIFLCYALAFTALLKWFGFIIACALSLSCAMLVLRIKPLWLVILIAFSIPSLLEAILWYGLTIQLPSISFL